jgi:hypothetical protein
MSKQRKDIGSVLKRVLERIESTDPQDRHEGYTALQHDAEFLHGRIPKEWVARLLKAFLNETDEVLHDLAIGAMFSVSLMPSPESPLLPDEGDASKGAAEGNTKGKAASKSAATKKLLGEWLFEPFLQKSAVISVFDAKMSRRDEPAEVYLGRRLSFDRHRATEFIHFSATEPRAHLVLPNQSFKAICVIGRPGLFGEPWFLPLMRYPSPAEGGENGAAEALRFGFDVHRRSPDVPHNQLDPAYHHLVERRGDGSIELLPTDDDGHSRRDYGLVQRYAVELGGQPTVIVVIAGASSLGTLGAARWASLTLFPNPDDPESDAAAIPMPETKRAPVRLEALVRVTADSTQGAWESPNIELLNLSIDAETWSPADRRWLPTAPDEMTLVYREGQLERILFDRRAHTFGNPSKMYVLTKALAEAVLQGRRQWSLDELRADQSAWGLKAGAPPITGETAAEQLRTLRNRHLGTALTIDGDQIHWRCKVRRVDEA